MKSSIEMNQSTMEIKSFRGLKPLKDPFGSNINSDEIARRRPRTAKRRSGGSVTAHQMLKVTPHPCPWQVFEDPSTGESRLERCYDPSKEPLNQKDFEEP